MITYGTGNLYQTYTNASTDYTGYDNGTGAATLVAAHQQWYYPVTTPWNLITTGSSWDCPQKIYKIQQHVKYEASVIYANQVASINYINWQCNYAETEDQKLVRLATENERVAAENKAEELLMIVLTEEQKLQYRELGYFETAVDDRVYRIKKGRSGNVYQIVEGKEQFRYCAHPSEYVPDQDTMIAQLLMLMNDEKKFLETANRTVLHP